MKNLEGLFQCAGCLQYVSGCDLLEQFMPAMDGMHSCLSCPHCEHMMFYCPQPEQAYKNRVALPSEEQL